MQHSGVIGYLNEETKPRKNRAFRLSQISDIQNFEDLKESERIQGKTRRNSSVIKSVESKKLEKMYRYPNKRQRLQF